jgi:4-amino-4-deoxy-L-arabinose transferase-like glycosyltransferase
MTAQPPSETTATPAQRIGWAILILVTLYICYFSHLGVIGFVGPDEPRYAWIARDMAETGDWVTPRLYGKPWFEKPPLLYWGGAVFFKLIGEDHPEVAARLPSAISALLATLALAWLAWRSCGEECARWLLLLLPTSIGMIGFSHAAATDMPFAGMLTIAMVCAAVVLGLVHSENTPILPHTPWLALVLFGFFLGLTMLAKGPAAIILSGGAIFFWVIFTKRWSDAFRLLHPAAVAAFCLTALPWYVLCARRNPDFFRIFIIEHNFNRYLTPEFQHIQPFWYYIPILFVAFLPWSFLVIAAGAIGLRHWWRTREMGALTCLILCWAGFCLVFFSISKSKLPGYILPALPAVSLLVAHATSGQSRFSRRLAGYSLVGTGGIYFAATLFSRFGNGLPEPSHIFSWEIALIAFVAFGLFCLATFFAGISFFLRHDSLASASFHAASMLPIILLLGLTQFLIEKTYLDTISGKWMSRMARSEVPDLDNLRTIGYRRDHRYALNFYLHREVPEWTDAPVTDGYVLSNFVYCDKLKTTDNCVDLWGMRDFVPGGALLRITPKPSLDRPGGGRQPQQKE